MTGLANWYKPKLILKKNNLTCVRFYCVAMTIIKIEFLQNENVARRETCFWFTKAKRQQKKGLLRVLYITISFVGFKSPRSTLVPEISFNVQRCTYKCLFWHTKLKKRKKFFLKHNQTCPSVVNFNPKHLLVNFLSSLLKKEFFKTGFSFFHLSAYETSSGVGWISS